MELAALIAVIALAVVYEWRHTRIQERFQQERDQWTAERDAHRQEIAALCQRIQAPEYAIVQHQQENAPPNMPAAHPMVDDDYWQADDERQMAIAKIEQLEREGFDLSPVT